MLNLLKSLLGNDVQSLDGKAFKESYRATKDAVLLDVRTPGEFASGTITGARNINLLSPDFDERIKSLKPEKTYFVFCRSGSRSAQACRVMTQKGLKAINLSGGIGAWPN